MYICKRERKLKLKSKQEAMKTMNSTTDRKNLKEFELSINEMINIRGGETEENPKIPVPPVVI